MFRIFNFKRGLTSSVSYSKIKEAMTVKPKRLEYMFLFLSLSSFIKPLAKHNNNLCLQKVSNSNHAFWYKLEKILRY